ncbi:MAG: 4Fe-4S ferredoxin [Syntrophaceae bacterium]|nr:4Fe-4S ferredoxin [Syntrophaceae bacterium]
MKRMRNIIEIDEELCDGCGNCIISCAEGALEIVDGKARLVAEKYCDGLGACLGECPTGALKVIQREADDFDEEAVEHRLAEISEKSSQETPGVMACGCPSTHIQTFTPAASACACANEPKQHASQDSALSHWPVQIQLVPASAPFLKNADLLVAADCTAYAYAGFHSELLAGKALMVGCPKFDDARAYIEKFAEIFEKANIKSVTVAIMEVPCCSGLPEIIKYGMKMAGKQIPLEKIIISSRGEIIKREKLAA